MYLDLVRNIFTQQPVVSRAFLWSFFSGVEIDSRNLPRIKIGEEPLN